MYDLRDAVIGWHLRPAKGHLNHGDPTQIFIGKTITPHGIQNTCVSACSYGLHAAETILGAVAMGPGPLLSKVILLPLAFQHPPTTPNQVVCPCTRIQSHGSGLYKKYVAAKRIHMWDLDISPELMELSKWILLTTITPALHDQIKSIRTAKQLSSCYRKCRDMVLGKYVTTVGYPWLSSVHYNTVFSVHSRIVKGLRYNAKLVEKANSKLESLVRKRMGIEF